MRLGIVIFVFSLCLFQTTEALSETWELKGGVGPAFGTTFSSRTKDGLGASAYLELGISESFSLAAGGTYIRHFIGKGLSYSFTDFELGALYKIDVLALTPFISAKLGWLDQAFDYGQTNSGLAGSLSIGLDYLVIEYLTVGLVAEYHGLLTNLSTFPGYAAFMGRIGFRIPH